MAGIKVTAVHRIESRKSGKKEVIEPGTVMNLSKKLVEELGAAVKPVEDAGVVEDTVEGSGEGSGDETGA